MGSHAHAYLKNILGCEPVKINEIVQGTGYIDIDLDVTIKHPMIQDRFDGYDVRGMFIGDGSNQLNYNPDLRHSSPGVDQILLNADGYSRWFNPAEFLVD